MAIAEGREASNPFDAAEVEGENPAGLDLALEVRQAYTDSRVYIENEIAPAREIATRYYLGRPLGTEEDGRSKFIMTEVRDSVLQIMPDLTEIFLSQPKVFEFEPVNAEDVPGAEQATAYVNHVLMKDNNGYRILYSALKDALVRKAGVVKWMWLPAPPPTEEEEMEITPDELLAVRADPEIEILKASLKIQGKISKPFPLDDIISAVTGQTPPEMPPLTLDVTVILKVLRQRQHGKAVVYVVPPEEFLIDRRATCVADAEYVAHRRFMHISEIVSMGFDYEEIVENADAGNDQFQYNPEVIARRPEQMLRTELNTADDSMKLALYVEHFIRRDLDGDGVAELHRVCTIGGAHHVLFSEVVPEAPFALFQIDPEPHVTFGLSMADYTSDLQLVKSSVVRATLDGIQRRITPRTAFVEGQVNVEDLLNQEIGGLVRMRQQGMVQELESGFDAQSALGLLGYLDEIKTNRTGISRATTGLEASALQSTTSAAVDLQRNAGESRKVLIARNLAEGGFRDLGRGLLRLLCRYQDKARVMRLTNGFVPMDPRSWNADMDCTVAVGLGYGDRTERMAQMDTIIGMQRELLTTLGAQNPLTNLATLRNAIEERMNLAGYKDVSRFFLPIDPNSPPADPTDQNSDPNAELAKAQAMLVQVQAQKVQQDGQIAVLKAKLDDEKQRMADDRERDRIELDAFLRAKELELKYGTQFDMAAMDAIVNHNRNQMQAQAKVQAAAMPPQPPQPPQAPPQGQPPLQ